jgi:hypothetical protein
VLRYAKFEPGSPQDNQRHTERLEGARDNTRFLDKRVGELEAQLIAGAVAH